MWGFTPGHLWSMPSLTKNKAGQRRQTELFKTCIKTGRLCEGYLEDLAGVQLVSLDLWACISGHCDSGPHWVLRKYQGAWSGRIGGLPLLQPLRSPWPRPIRLGPAGTCGWRSAQPAAAPVSSRATPGLSCPVFCPELEPGLAVLSFLVRKAHGHWGTDLGWSHGADRRRSHTNVGRKWRHRGQNTSKWHW